MSVNETLMFVTLVSTLRIITNTGVRLDQVGHYLIKRVPLVSFFYTSLLAYLAAYKIKLISD